MEMVRFVNSGTEAVMSAIRLARAYTRKNKIVKFAGCYHGHSDFLLAQAGSGVATLSLPGSAGVPDATVADTLIAPYNDIEFIEQLFETWHGQIAAIIVEPVPGNMGVVLPENDFLRQLRDITYKNESLLIMDEVMSGFRQRFGGAQHYFGVEGDITCLGKIIGGGLPVGAYGGKREIMSMVAPLGPVYQAGTLSGNPLAMAAGVAMLTYLKENDVYTKVNSYTSRLGSELENIASKHKVPLQVPVFGSMFTPFLSAGKITDYECAKKSDTERFAKLFWKLLENGIFPPPSQFEAWFVSAAMGDEELQKTIEAFDRAFSGLT
jgi:glutamate-1-semialdehyde 2,1-aminomutase